MDEYGLKKIFLKALPREERKDEEEGENDETQEKEKPKKNNKRIIDVRKETERKKNKET